MGRGRIPTQVEIDDIFRCVENSATKNIEAENSRKPQDIHPISLVMARCSAAGPPVATTHALPPPSLKIYVAVWGAFERFKTPCRVELGAPVSFEIKRLIYANDSNAFGQIVRY